MIKKAIILIIEDAITKSIHWYFSQLLTRHGCSLFSATDLHESLEILNQEKIELILLDMLLPGLGGFEVCKTIKSQKELKDVPIIFMTARIESDLVEKIFDAGAADYITKPFWKSQVLARIATHIELKRLREEMESYDFNEESIS